MRYIVFGLVIFASALGEVATGVFVPALTAVSTEFGLSDLSIQSILASFVVTLAVSQLLAGPISDLYGRRPVFLFGLTTLLLGGAAAGTAESANFLLFARILQGLGAAAIYVATRGSLRDSRSEKELPKTMGMLIIATMFAAVLSPLIGGYLLEYFGWRSIFFLLSVAIAITLIGVAVSFKETLSEANKHKISIKSLAEMYFELSLNRDYRKYAIIHSFGYASFYVFVAALPLLGRDILQIGPSAIGGALSVMTIGMVLGVVSATRVARKYGTDKCIGLGLALAVTGTGAFLAASVYLEAPSLQLIIASQALAAFGGGLVSPHTSSQVMLAQPNLAGLATAGLGFLSMSLAGSAMVVVGLLYRGAYFEVAAIQVLFTLISCIPLAFRGSKTKQIPTS